MKLVEMTTPLPVVNMKELRLDHTYCVSLAFSFLLEGGDNDSSVSFDLLS